MPPTTSSTGMEAAATIRQVIQALSPRFGGWPTPVNGETPSGSGTVIVLPQRIQGPV